MSEHYKFPNTAEVIDITRYLSSNGGQAVQYIARSTRMDGNNKGDLRGRLKDLEKARDFITDEELRLESILEDDEDSDVPEPVAVEEDEGVSVYRYDFSAKDSADGVPNDGRNQVTNVFGSDGKYIIYEHYEECPEGFNMDRNGKVINTKNTIVSQNRPFIHLGAKRFSRNRQERARTAMTVEMFKRNAQIVA